MQKEASPPIPPRRKRAADDGGRPVSWMRYYSRPAIFATGEHADDLVDLLGP
jgi:hypothetical protein